MEKKTIDIQQLISSDTMFENHQTIARKIATRLIKERNNHNNVIIGYELLDYVMDLPGFHVSFSTDKIEMIGILMGIKVFRDNTNYVKHNEYFFFKDEKSLQFLQREEKLRRILNDNTLQMMIF